MKTLPTIALALALAVGGTALAQPAFAQDKKEEAQQRKFNLSSGARKPISELQTAVTANDEAGYTAKLPAAQKAAKNNDDRYVVAQLMLQWAIAKNDDRLKLAAIEALEASGGATPEEMGTVYQNIAALKTKLGDTAGAEAAMAKLAQAQPDNPDVIVTQAEMKASQQQPAEALQLFQKAIAAKKAQGPVPEEWYKRGLKFAFEGKNPQATAQLSRELVSAYPTQENWRDTLLIYRDTTNLDKPATIDLLRLVRQAKAMAGERDYYELAEALNDRGLPGETKAVLDEGIAAKAVDPNKLAFSEMLKSATDKIPADRKGLPAEEQKALAGGSGTAVLGVADAYYGYGDYAKAATLYKAALQKGGVDANLANTRLGIALAMAGQKAEAETAFKAVTGQRADIASFWMLWLNQRA
ncbi:hypothetical protein SAMN06295910_2505 [Allosphingosinicella indica]|uniref:Tetratricopeptide repeat protein n=2 Tax=Allosphingosinicella indica TaxID=941907 RepID=A0A1X7GYM4_9SPHN|nr:hypothetical protein SAMN06295910_2505 [Allosphingosinicella indica]